MNEEQNGCAESIGQALSRHGVPDYLVAQVNSLCNSVADLRVKLEFARLERPRTITLEYMPRVTYEEDDRLPDEADRGGHWTITEAGRAMPALDSRECLALVAAMLLGAPHPSLQSVQTMQSESYREASKRRRAEEHIAALNRSFEDVTRERLRLQDRLGSLPWCQARELLAGAKPRPGVPSNPEGPDLFRILLCELEDYRQAEEYARREREERDVGKTIRLSNIDAAERETLIAALERNPPSGGTLIALENTDDMVGAADRMAVLLDQRPASLTLEFSSPRGTFRMIGRPIEAIAGEPSAEVVEAAAADQDAELEELCNALEVAGYARTSHEVRVWWPDWRVDAQNFAIAWAAWKKDGERPSVQDDYLDERKLWQMREPTAPWFLTGAPDPNALEADAAEEHAGFGLEPLAADDAELYVDGEAVERVPGAFAVPMPPRDSVDAVPYDAVRGAPLDPDDAFMI